MKYFTFRKAITYTLFSCMSIGAVYAQDTPPPPTIATPKLFGGTQQYRTWGIGFNVGYTSPAVATGGSRDFNGSLVRFGYGVSVKKQLAHAFNLQLDVRGGRVDANTNGDIPSEPGALKSFISDDVTGNRFVSSSTDFYQASLSGVVNVTTIDFLRRENLITLFVNAGAGLAAYRPNIKGFGTDGTDGSWLAFRNPNGGLVKELIIPVGFGFKFKMSETVSIDLGYTQNFLDGDNFDGVHKNYPTKDRYSYSYFGVDIALGSNTKPNLGWTNPVAIMYDELYDKELRKEVEALKTRINGVESAMQDLKKDTDGDGVNDLLDKCPGTPANSVIDGSGCVIVFPKADTAQLLSKQAGNAVAYPSVQFEFNSSILKTPAYPVLDAISTDLRTSGAAIIIEGFASSEGSAAHNLQLSKDRANSVKTYLVTSGVAENKLTTKGLGETRPIADNSTEKGRALNRRVEFKR